MASIVQLDFNAKDQIDSLLLSLRIARRKLCLRRNETDLAIKYLIRIGIDIDLRFLADFDLTDLGFGNVNGEIQTVNIADFWLIMPARGAVSVCLAS